MNSNVSNSHDELLEILESYAAATPEGNDKKLLDEWIAAHPEHAQEIIDFAVSRSMLQFNDSAGFQSDDERNAYLARTRETYKRFVDSHEVTLRSIVKRAAELDLKKKELIDSLGISPILLDSLENRAIEFASIPKTFITRISGVLKVNAEAVSAYLQQPILAAGFHKNITRPENVRAVSFSKAIQDDLMLTEEQKKELLSLM